MDYVGVSLQTDARHKSAHQSGRTSNADTLVSNHCPDECGDFKSRAPNVNMHMMGTSFDDGID
jgi:hypothetical protein